MEEIWKYFMERECFKEAFKNENFINIEFHEELT